MPSRQSDCILEPNLDYIDLESLRKVALVRESVSPFYGGTHLATAVDLLIDIILEHRLEDYDVETFDGGFTITCCRVCHTPDEYWCDTVLAIAAGWDGFFNA